MALVNLAWSMESGVWNSIPNSGFTSKNVIAKHTWYSTPIPMVYYLMLISHRTYYLAKTDGYGKNSCLPERVPFGG